MKYLVDANVLSEPTKPSPDLRVVDWLRTHEPDITVDPVILGELRFGILILPKGKRRMALESWFHARVGRLHCLPWDCALSIRSRLESVFADSFPNSKGQFHLR